jgi:tRNA A37 threonylcarbamoyltransferase TsaD
LIARLCGEEIVHSGVNSSNDNISNDNTNNSSNNSSNINNNNNSNNNNNNSNNIIDIKSNIIENKDFIPKIKYPFLALLVSGGHTSILLCKGLGNYTVLGGTLDDSLGEAFDKAARLLSISSSGTSGGAVVEQYAKKSLGKTTIPTSLFKMKIPLKDKANCNFSYSGLKNAFRIAVECARMENGVNIDKSQHLPMEAVPLSDKLPDDITADLCSSFQYIAFSHVEDRIKRALTYIIEQDIDISSLVVVGGVAANLELRSRLLNILDTLHNNRIDKEIAILNNTINKKYESLLSEDSTLDNNISKTNELNLGNEKISKIKKLKLIFPPPSLCTDNGVMVAWAGIEKLNNGISDPIENQECIARWPIGEQLENSNEAFRKK